MSNDNGALVPAGVSTDLYFSPDQVELIKRQIAKDCTNDELKLFLYQCARTGLDPFSKQIYALKRKEKDGERWIEKLSIQTGIDGFRLIADRTQRYAPGPDNEYVYDDEKRLVKATAHVMKFAGGQWHKVSASAHFLEYAQTKAGGGFTKMWAEKPHIMLGKCAEALALRKAFPAELSGLYTQDEMPETPPAPVEATYIPPAVEKVFPGAKAVNDPKAETTAPGATTSTTAPAPADKPQRTERQKRLGSMFTLPPAQGGLGWKGHKIVAHLKANFGGKQTLAELTEAETIECERQVIQRITEAQPVANGTAPEAA
jgi:phage recombination protein Bet